MDNNRLDFREHVWSELKWKLFREVQYRSRMDSESIPEICWSSTRVLRSGDFTADIIYDNFHSLILSTACPSGRAVWCAYDPGCGFESRWGHGCMFATFCVVLFCVRTGLAMGRVPAQRVLPKCLNKFIVSEFNYEYEQARKTQHVYLCTIYLMCQIQSSNHKESNITGPYVAYSWN